MLAYKLDRATQYRLSSEWAEPLELVRSKPFSHTCTGMVLRGFAAHPRYRRHEAALHGARLLKSRFFLPDAYTSYHAASYWVRFEYPFWWNNLLSAMDSIALIEAPDAAAWAGDAVIQRALAWFIEHQEEDGGWKNTYAKPEPDKPATFERRLWVTLAICRVLRSVLSHGEGLRSVLRHREGPRRLDGTRAHPS